MKDEIKEINIKIPGQILDYVDTKEHLLELFNHITNLQEYKRCFNLMGKFRDKALAREYDYKSRIDKAIEYIKANRNVDDYGKFIIEDDKNILLNILTGGD